MALFHSFSWVTFHCRYAPCLLYPFLCWWTFKRLPRLGYCKQCCNVSFGLTHFKCFQFHVLGASVVLWNNSLILQYFFFIVLFWETLISQQHGIPLSATPFSRARRASCSLRPSGFSFHHGCWYLCPPAQMLHYFTDYNLRLIGMEDSRVGEAR